MTDSPLRLRAQDEDDLTIVSTMVQDMVIAKADMAFDQAQRLFALVGNRYRWEKKRRWFRKPKGERIRSAVHLSGVLSVQSQALDTKPDDEILSLIAITCEKSGENWEILLAFSGGSSIRILAECIDVVVTDMGEPWDAIDRPKHQN